MEAIARKVITINIIQMALEEEDMVGYLRNLMVTEDLQDLLGNVIEETFPHQGISGDRDHHHQEEDTVVVMVEDNGRLHIADESLPGVAVRLQEEIKIGQGL